MDTAKTLMVNIVTWNSARFLPSLFESFDTQTSRDFSVTVIDNASTDGTVEWLSEYRATVPVLKNYRNVGFSKAHNQGISLSLRRWAEAEDDLTRRYVLVLNPDTVLDSACIAHIIAYMDTHPDVSIAGPKLLRAIRLTDDEGDEMAIERTTIIDSAGFDIRKSRRAYDRGAGEEDVGQYDASEPFGISGAALVLRASAIESLRLEDQLFDEDFFAYKEDVDLSWRARLFGLGVQFIPHARIWHYRTAKRNANSNVLALAIGQRKRSVSVNRLSRRNQIWTELKNDDTVNRWMHLPWRIIEIGLRSAACIVFPQHVRAVYEAWIGRGKMLRKRRLLQAKRKRSPAEMRTLFT